MNENSKYRLSKINNTQDPKIKEKEIEYFNYIKEHVANVQTSWNNMKNMYRCMQLIMSCEQYTPNDIIDIDKHISNHDATKYSDAEWYGYRAAFYSIDENEKKNNEELANEAWKHHYENNPHHWDYWYMTHSENSMTIPYVVEMCCDWIAMSMKFGGSALDWYNSKAGEIYLGDFQKKLVIDLLSEYYKK